MINLHAESTPNYKLRSAFRFKLLITHAVIKNRIGLITKTA